MPDQLPPAPTSASLFPNDKFLQGLEHFFHIYVLSNFTYSSTYYQVLPLFQVSGAGTIEAHKAATAQPSLVPLGQQLQRRVVSALLEIHKDVMLYKIEGTQHSQGALPARAQPCRNLKNK